MACETLNEDAKCWTGLGGDFNDAVSAYLTCMWANSFVPGEAFYLLDADGNYITDETGQRIVINV